MVTKAIDAREARIKTAAVDVKALTISGKQVTLSVFRQLKHEQVVDPKTLTLRGVPWGTVNYFWGDDSRRGSELLHVVWQLGDELRRALVPNSLYGFQHWSDHRDMVDEYFRGAHLLGIAEGKVEMTNSVVRTVAGRTLRYSVHYTEETARSIIGYGPRSLSDREREELRSEASRFYVMDSFAEAVEHCTTTAQQLNEAEAQWSQLHGSLTALDQLFIAV